MSTTVSTNADARSGAHGDVYVADYQTSGRGRLNHRWLAPPGVNLTFSVVLGAKGSSPEEVATMPLVVGLGVARAIASLACAGVAVKWPNDVLVDGRKIAGILCERNGEDIIAGIGVNVNQREFPAEIAARATSLALVAGEFDRELVLERMLGELADVYAKWKEEGFGGLSVELSELDCLKGRVVAVLQTDRDPEPVTGLCGGIQKDGTLLVGSTRIYAVEAHIL